MTEPTVTCALCERSVIVRPDGRGFPPDIAKRKLRKLCKAEGCQCEPVYRAGILLGGRVTGMQGAGGLA